MPGHPQFAAARPLPVSRKDFRLESTRGQPPFTLPGIVEPALNWSCFTVRHTESLTVSISNVTRDLSLRSSGLAQDSRDVIVIPKTNNVSRLIPISVSGFSGEADSVLKFDLSVLGMELTTPDKADYLVSGTEDAGRLAGRLKQGGAGGEVFGRIYSSGTSRSQAHAFADDIVKEIRGTPSIFHSRIAFCRKVGANMELYVSDFDGHNLLPMTHDGSLVAAPSWSPGGRNLFYTSWKSGYTQIIENEAATGNRTVFAAYLGGNFNAVPSPDGSRVAMILSKGGSPNLYVSDRNGGNLQQLTRQRDEASSPTWSPDGR